MDNRFSDSRIKEAIRKQVKIFDSTTISLFQDILKCVGRKPKSGKNKGGVVYTAVKFDPKATDFTIELTHLDTIVSNLLDYYNAKDVAVYFCSFGEGTNILGSAGNYPHLKRVSWFGSSAFAQNASLIAETSASGFASSQTLPCPIFGLDEEAKAKWEPLKERIQQQVFSPG